VASFQIEEEVREALDPSLMGEVESNPPVCGPDNTSRSLLSEDEEGIIP
jgi:hypothetical protein